MGTIAARDCLRVLQLTEQVAAALLMVVTQGIQLREKQSELTETQLTRGVKKTKDQVQQVFTFLEEDRPLEQTLRDLTVRIQQQGIELHYD